MLLRLMALVTAVVHMASAQGGRGNVLRQGDTGGDTQSVITTARTRAFLSCESGDIVVKVNFTQPFRGLMYAFSSRSSPCRVHGTGGTYYELRIPLKGCGTWQESPRVFVNNITIRFHPALELEEDETKTVVCRYPPPLTQPPGSVHVVETTHVTPTPIPTRVSTARLSEVEILIIICLLLFLSLLTLGIGIAYFCLKRRNIRIVRKTALSSAPPSQITRLSSSNLQPPSLLSSVLGHTVRIPRAVPYSAPAARSVLSSPDHHHYEDSSATETTSGEVSETSVSSSSLVEDHLDSTRNLLYQKGGPKSILSIPKAILRRAGPRRWRTEQPTVHQLQARPDSAATTSIKRLEMEDQTVTTMLESENHVDQETYWALKGQGGAKKLVQEDKKQTSAASSDKAAVPVYAQVDKNKKTATTSTATNKQQKSTKGTETPKWSAASAVPGSAKRQLQVVTETPEDRKTSEEVTKNTTVTTSVRREVKETRIMSPALDRFRKEAMDELDHGRGVKKESSSDLPTIQENSEESSLEQTPKGLKVQKAPKSILIRDVSDIYLTTTVETELRELTTKVSRDTVEQHARAVEEPPRGVAAAKPLTETNNWNVIIRQRAPYVPETAETDVDASGESNGESTDEPDSVVKPQFDVKIRTIPPEELQPKKTGSDGHHSHPGDAPDRRQIERSPDAEAGHQCRSCRATGRRQERTTGGRGSREAEERSMAGRPQRPPPRGKFDGQQFGQFPVRCESPGTLLFRGSGGGPHTAKPGPNFAEAHHAGAVHFGDRGERALGGRGGARPGVPVARIPRQHPRGGAGRLLQQAEVANAHRQRRPQRNSFIAALAAAFQLVDEYSFSVLRSDCSAWDPDFAFFEKDSMRVNSWSCGSSQMGEPHEISNIPRITELSNEFLSRNIKKVSSR